MNGDDMLLNYDGSCDIEPCDDYSPTRCVSIVRSGSSKITEEPFISIKKGDLFFVGGDAYIASSDAHIDPPSVLSTCNEEWYSEYPDHNMECVFLKSAKEKHIPAESLIDSVFSIARQNKFCRFEEFSYKPSLSERIQTASSLAQVAVSDVSSSHRPDRDR